jgi:hypothetical protein
MNRTGVHRCLVVATPAALLIGSTSYEMESLALSGVEWVDDIISYHDLALPDDF